MRLIFISGSKKNGGDGERILKNFSQDVFNVLSEYIPSGAKWHIGDDISADLDAGLLSAKVNCLIESLMEYRTMKDLRCIIFVERVITAIVLQSLLSEVLVSNGWKVTYMAGNRSGLQSQTRKEHFDIIDLFRKGTVNVIVATQILEEGLDVQRCNLVVRFDPSNNVCSFIQSRGRARMEGSDYLLIVRSGDASVLSKVRNYLASGDIMREESLRYATLPCAPLKSEMYDEEFYRVETTGALVTLSSSVALIYYYCSQLPSDRYFKPTPRFIYDKESKLCTLHLPKSCPLQMVCVHGQKDILKKLVCLEACRKLHKIGALTDNLLPESVEEDANAFHIGDMSFEEEQVNYFPGELVSPCPSHSDELYYCYIFNLNQNFDYDVPFRDIILAVKCDLGNDFAQMDFELVVNRGSVTVNMIYAGTIYLSPEQVAMGRKFQITVLRILIDQTLNLSKLTDAMDGVQENDPLPRVNYLVLPSIDSDQKPRLIDWDCVSSLLFPMVEVRTSEDTRTNHRNFCSAKSYKQVHTKDSVVCRCMLVDSLVYTPHNGCVYCVTGFLDGINGNSSMKLRGGEVLTYKKYYQSRHRIDLQHDEESLLRGRHIFTVQNCLQRRKYHSEKESSNNCVELPPELCGIIMSSISVGTLYSFSLVPSIMHRMESMLLALNLKKLHSDHYTKNVNVPTMKVLEAITGKKCQEEFSLESLETLGDSFLKYAVSQQLFRIKKHHHEGLLSTQKERMVSNNVLCKLGCERGIQGFIRYELFDPKQWAVPGALSGYSQLEEVSLCTSVNIYVMGARHMKSKVVADVVEGLIGAYLIRGGELAALLLMDWLGMKIDFVKEVPNDRQFLTNPERHINVSQLECLLKYSFHDPSLLVEALTHGSYQLPEITTCYQRLEFLGDAVLDHLITLYLYTTYPGISPGQLTDLRSSSANNDCYALAAVKAGLHKHILHASSELHKQIKIFVNSFGQLSLQSTFGWESDSIVPKALGDIIESLAGAIFVDSGYNKETVWKCIRPMLEPLVTPETLKLQPERELNELCQRKSYERKTYASSVNGQASYTVEVKVNGTSYSHTCTGTNKITAKKIAAKNVLESLKANKLG